MQVVYEVGDVTDCSSIDLIVDRTRPDIIVHTAGTVPVLANRYGRDTRDHVLNVNVNGTRNMLAVAKRYKVQTFVWTGSCTSVTDDTRYQYANVDERWPTSSHSLIYGESKVYPRRFEADIALTKITGSS